MEDKKSKMSQKLTKFAGSLVCSAITVASTFGFAGYFADNDNLRTRSEIESPQFTDNSEKVEKESFDIGGALFGFGLGLTTFVGFHTYEDLKREEHPDEFTI